MYYITKLPSNIARISMKLPSEDCPYPYVEQKSLPEGSGILMFDDNDKLFYAAVPIAPEQSPSEPNEFERLRADLDYVMMMEGLV